MAIALSAQMMTNLVGLTSINNDMSGVQARLASGKKIDSALDNAAVYFRATSMQEKSDAYDAVNAGISAGLKNVQLANKGLDTMYSNLEGLLTQLKDAASKSIAATNNVATVGGKTFASISSSMVAAQTGTPAATSATDLADSTLFNVGDRFSISYRQADGTTRTRNFEASATAGTGTQSGVNNSADAANCALRL
jgi:flagellin